LTADPGARLVAMCDILRDRIEAQRANIKAARGAQVIVEDDHCFTGFEAYNHVIEASDVVLIANGVKLMQQACDLAKEENLCIVSGLQSRFHEGSAETVKRIQDGAIGEVVSIQENYLRSPYRV
jgi:hypothetical protein